MSKEEQYKRELIQEVIDRLLYSPGYEEKLLELNKEFKVNKIIKYFPIPSKDEQS